MSENRSVRHNPLPSERTLQPKKSQGHAKLSTVMLTNIALLVIVAVASAVILMFGDFEGKVIRTVTTLILFAVFTAFAAFDSTRDAPPRYMLISQIGHMYMLLLSLILIWGSLLGKHDHFDDFSILTKTILIIVLVKVAVIAEQRISDAVYAPQPQVALVAKFCAGFFALTAVLFTQPMGTDYFIIYSDAYWKFAVIILIFAALSISITLLISWYFGNNVEDKRRETRVASAANAAASASIAKTPHYDAVREDQPFRLEPFDKQEQVAPEDANAPVHHLATTEPEPAPSSPPSYAVHPPARTQAPSANPRPASSPSTEYARPVAGPQPWPVFPNGQPLPAAQNGRPDFAVLQYVASVHAEAERQWFSA